MGPFYVPISDLNWAPAHVEYYNHRRNEESLDNMTPADVYLGRAQKIFEQQQNIKRETINRGTTEHRKAIDIRYTMS